MHGGTQKRGPANANYTNGKRSKWNRAFGDEITPEDRASMLDMAHGLQAQEHAIQAMRDRLEAGASVDFKDEVIGLRECYDEGDMDGLEKHLGTIEGDLETGKRDDARLKQLSEAGARLTVQQKAVADVHYAARSVLAPDDARTLISRLVEIVAEEVNRDVAARIIKRLDAELALGGAGPTGGRGDRVVEAGR